MAAIEIPDLVQAQLIATLPAGAVAPTVIAQRGFTGTPVRSGAGVYTFDLEEADIDADALMVLLGNGATAAPAGLFVTAELTPGTPNRVTVRTFDATGAAADAGCRVMLELHRLPAG